jgi:hypothetical protein
MPPDEVRAPAADRPAEPWGSFLRDLDELLKGTIELRCLGGFVVTQHYGVGQTTSDIDFLTIFNQSPEDDIQALAGLGSSLNRKYGLYVQYVGVVTPPADYAARLTRMFPAAPWRRLKLFALDPIDLALSKLERNADRDRADFLALAQAGYLDRDVFERRYHDELRPYLLSKHDWHDKTLQLWLEMAWPTKEPSRVIPKNAL